MKAIWLIALNTFREVVRNKILYSVLAFALLLLIISALFGSVTLGDRIAVIKDFGLFALSFCGAIIVILSGVNLLDRELRQKTIYNLLSKPVRRWEFVVGKFLGLSLVSTVLTSAMAIVFIGFTAAFEGRIDPLLFQGALLVLLEMILLSAVAIFFSSVVVTTALAGLFTFGAYLAGHSIEALNYFLNTQAEFSSSFLRGFALLLKAILPDLNTFNITEQVVYGSGVSLGYVGLSFVYALIYSVVCILLASVIFAQRDFQ